MFRGLGNVIIWLVVACLLCGCANNIVRIAIDNMEALYMILKV